MPPAGAYRFIENRAFGGQFTLIFIVWDAQQCYSDTGQRLRRCVTALGGLQPVVDGLRAVEEAGEPCFHLIPYGCALSKV